MEDFNFDQIFKESEERDARWKRIEEEGAREIVKYFDRIHNNLFSYNNILIAAFFALGQFTTFAPRWSIIIPLINMWFLMYIDYRMMEKSRFEASITEQPFDKIEKQGKYISNTNLISLLSIITTFFVTLSLLYYML